MSRVRRMWHDRHRRPCPDDGIMCGTWHRFWRWWWEWDATFVSRRALVLVLVLFTVFCAYGFNRLENTSDDTDRVIDAQAEVIADLRAVVKSNRANAARIEFEGKARDFEACVDSNEDKASIVAYITALAGPPESRSPGAQAALDRAVEQFAAEECPPEPAEPDGGGQ